MKYSERYDHATNANVVTIKIGDIEMVRVKKTEKQMACMKKLSKSDKVSDKILAIHLTAKVIEDSA